MARKDEGIPGGRVQRTAKVGQALGSAGARYAGTRARNVVRSKDDATAELDKRHLEAAERMVGRARPDEGRGDEDRPARLVHRHRLPAAGVPRAVPGQARAAAQRGADDAVGARCARCSRRSGRTRSRSCSRTSSRRPRPPPRSARCTAPTLPDGRRVAVKIQYPGVAKALRADMQNAGHDHADGEGARARASTPRRPPPSSRSACSRSSTTSTRRRTSARSRAPTAATRSSTCPT